MAFALSNFGSQEGMGVGVGVQAALEMAFRTGRGLGVEVRVNVGRQPLFGVGRTLIERAWTFTVGVDRTGTGVAVGRGAITRGKTRAGGGMGRGVQVGVGLAVGVAVRVGVGIKVAVRVAVAKGVAVRTRTGFVGISGFGAKAALLPTTPGVTVMQGEGAMGRLKVISKSKFFSTPCSHIHSL